MSKSGNETIVLGLTLLVTLGLAGGGYWLVQKNLPTATNSTPTDSATPQSNQSVTPGSQPTQAGSSLGLDASLPNPNVIAIDGSTAMVALVKELRNAYSQVNPNIPTTFGVPEGKPNGSSGGIKNLINNTVLMAASSRPLQANEAQADVKLVAIARDAVAVVVGVNNSFKGNLSLDQLKGIYQGKITNWSQLGGGNIPIKVINRATQSGTRDLFQNVVLQGEQFASDGVNFITWKQDETTAILRALGNDGISYATISQVENQTGTVRIITVDNISPTDKLAVKNGTYPISRNLYLGVHKKTSPAVQQFVELALSPQGQAIAQRLGFISIP